MRKRVVFSRRVNKKKLSKLTQNKKLQKIVAPEKIIRSDWRKKIKMSFSAPSIWNVPENSEKNIF
jgi:hypothetical protein